MNVACPREAGWPPVSLPRRSRGLVLLSSSAGETRLLGQRLSQFLSGNEVIALSGPLGAGKTCLVQGMARGLGIRQPVNSPAYVLMKRYRGRFTLTHWDWYRLADNADLESCGFGDPQIEPGVVVIEWAERFPEQLERPFLKIEIIPMGRRSRRLVLGVSGRSAALRRLIRDVKAWWDTRRPGRPS
jgi:tRNA threonylcarbamoyladenosine biosynthesis protein TsaE